ncbi:ECF RNA polymerase sigma factor SigK [Amycolatopsis rhabdoformis]|uniref:ECF RNA polymerase sigma factor SigK n=1 Tax=Amycolatopsis rhabdoformis TaxID=1448059 RepID=A0ABZ1IJV9_9PSEU|nr:ECF RNA polymerase sigma factor SigK [Amycolatopsis rhabdoformis]WSE34151.1 ECF RNA polymerase sigma factor SigK [Amycolatopsis rhabdoformis]
MTGHAATLTIALGPAESTVDPLGTAERLMERVAGGDEAAFAGLYDHLASPVLGMCFRVLRDRAQAEEVTQETLLEVWRKAATFSARKGSLRNWVLTIAHRRAIDRVRAESAGAAREERDAQLDPRREFDEVSEETLTGLARAEVREALLSLSEVQRESITLAYFLGWTAREVSERLGVPVGTIKSRLRDGLLRLRDLLGEKE